MQVLQIIHGTPQGYQSAPAQLVTRTHLFGNQQIQIAAAKPAKQPPQILPKPPHQQAGVSQQKQRVTTTITNQVSQVSKSSMLKSYLRAFLLFVVLSFSVLLPFAYPQIIK